MRPGDTLSGIAARFAVRGGWQALYAANRPLIGSDPNLIRPGTVLVLPGRMTPARYTVVAGDTLAGIAARLAVRGGSRGAVRGQPAGHRPRPEHDPPRDRADGPAPGSAGAGPGPPAPGAEAVGGSRQRAPSLAGGNGHAGRQRHAAVAEDPAAGRRPGHRGRVRRRAGTTGAPAQAGLRPGCGCAGAGPGASARAAAVRQPGAGSGAPRRGEKAGIVLADYGPGRGDLQPAPTTRSTCCGLPAPTRGRSCGWPTWCCQRISTGSWRASSACPPGGPSW